MEYQILSLSITPDLIGQRLDQALAKLVAAHPDALALGLSRNRLQQLIKEGAVCDETGAGLTQAAHKIKTALPITITIPPAAAPPLQGEVIALDILYEDDDVIVINKPAGLVVHPAPGNWGGTLVNALIAHCGQGLTGVGGEARPGIVHRLDKLTSGVMVAAKTQAAYIGLQSQFAAHDIERCYLALCHGMPNPAKGRIDAPIARHRTHRQKMAVMKNPEQGRAAITDYQILKIYGGGQASLVRCQLHTGRTHQIRVHFSHIGHSLLCDPIYGGRHKGKPDLKQALVGFDRQALHAEILGFTHPISGKALHFESPPPADFTALTARLGQLAGG